MSILDSILARAVKPLKLIMQDECTINGIAVVGVFSEIREMSEADEMGITISYECTLSVSKSTIGTPPWKTVVSGITSKIRNKVLWNGRIWDITSVIDDGIDFDLSLRCVK